MFTAQILTGLWDNGWLTYDSFGISPEPSDAALIQKYVNSPIFHSSFLIDDNDETKIHGPFLAHLISALDFVPLEEAGLENYFESMNLSKKQDEDEAAHTKIATHLRKAFGEDGRCYVLKYDERNKDVQHDLGWVHSLFREFLFTFPLRHRLDRFVIGYD